VVLIQTRWHVEDLAGWVQEEHQHEGWRLISMPALDEQDNPLWPERYPLEALHGIRETIGPRDWEALYQQRPVPRDGNLFKRAWFPISPAAPSDGQIPSLCRYWDKAATEGGGDYTAGVLVARLRDGRYAILDVVRGQWSPGTREATILQTAQLDAITYGDHAVQQVLEQEGGSAGKSDALASIQALAGHRVAAEHPTGSKEVRAQPLANQAEAGNVYLVAGPWNKAFLDELEAFPQGKNDDQVDAASGAFNRVALAAPRPRVIPL
jgi:predicted phage terminase large subunit-like protein